MSMYSRRQFLSGVGALGAATACPGIWAATLAQSGLSSEQILRLETQAAGFSNPLRLPGSSGLLDRKSVV
jgi:suppressor of ftsI/bilirubin oxidase